MKKIRKAGIRKTLALLLAMVMILALAPLTAVAAAPTLKSIDLTDLKAGEIGAETRNIQMIECGHEFSFDLILNAEFNEAVVDTLNKNPYDVVLVLDRSGSMSSPSSKWTTARNAAKAFVGVVDDYNEGTGVFAGTGKLAADNASRFALVSYSDTITSMQSTTTGSGGNTRFNVNSNTGALINPSGTTPPGTTGTSNKDLAERAIDSLASSGNTDIADGIKAAYDILNARTGADASRPGFIILMSDGVANRPYRHPSSDPHNSTVINGTQVDYFLRDTLGVSLTGPHQCNSSEPTTHTCSTAAAILRADEARAAGYIVYSVGFDLTQVTATARPIADQTLRMIAGEPRIGTLGPDSKYYEAGLSNDQLKIVFQNIVRDQITKEVNPVADSGQIIYNAPAGFTIKSVDFPTQTNAWPSGTVANIAADRKSFTLTVGDVFALERKLTVTIVADDDVLPGDHLIYGAGSRYSFTNVELNVLAGQPAWYTAGSGLREFYIDLEDWANGLVTVLPLAKNTTASVNILPTDTSFEIKLADLADAPYPAGGALSGSGDVMVGVTKIGTFNVVNGVIQVTLLSTHVDALTATLVYTYTLDNLVSCPKTLTIEIVPVIEPEIEIKKSIDDTNIDKIDPTAVYTLKVENTGYHPLVDVVVTDVLDVPAVSITIDSVLYNGAPASPSVTLTGSSGAYLGFKMSFPAFTSTDPFKPGDTITITYTVEYAQVINDPDADDARSNSATVEAKSTVDGTEVEDNDGVDATQEGAEKSATIDKSIYSINNVTTGLTAPYIVENGDVIIYKITVTNTGDLPLALTGINDGLTGAIRCNSDGTNSLVPIPGTLAVGASLTVYYKYIVDGEANNAVISNTATATFDDIDDIDDTETAQVAAPVIDVKKEINSASTDVTPGGLSIFPHGADVTFKVTITNSGDADAEATLSDYISSLDNAFFTSPSITFYTLNGTIKEPVTGLVTVPANDVVVVFYDVKVEGQTDAQWEADVNDAIKAVEDAYADYQQAIDDAQTAIDNAMDAISVCQTAVDAAEQALNDALEAYYTAGAAVYIYDANGEIIDVLYPAVDDTDVKDAEKALEDAQKDLADAEAALQDAQDALNKLIADGDILADANDPNSWKIAAAEDELQNLMINKGTQVFEYANHASYGVYDNDSVGFAVDYQKQPFLTLKKEVSVNGGALSKFEVANEGDKVEFTITVTNIGDKTSEEMVLIDVFDGVHVDEIVVPTIAPNGVFTYTFSSDDYDWSNIITNGSYTTAKLATNTAILGKYENSVFNAELSSSASVVVPPQPVARLSINKEVRASGSNAPFAKSAVVNSNEPVEFEFRITVTNSGDDDATVLMSDFFRGKEGDSLVGLLQGGVAGGYVTIPANDSVVLTLIYEIGVDEGEINVARYEATNQNVKNPTGSSSASARVNGVPYSVLSVEKKVYDGSSFVDSAKFYVSAGATKDAIFRITVKNEGSVTGQFTMEDAFDGNNVDLEDLYLSAFFQSGERLIDSSYYNAAGKYISVRAGESLSIYYRADGLSARGGAYINEVTIKGVRNERAGVWEIYDTVIKDADNADVVIESKTAIMVSVSIDKKVAFKGETADPADIADSDWKDSLDVTTGDSLDVYYRITVTKAGNADYAVSGSISDLFDGEEFALSNEQKSFEIGKGETTWVIYLSATLTGPGTHSNTAIIDNVVIIYDNNDETLDITFNVERDSSEVLVVITTPDTPYTPPPPPSTPSNPYVPYSPGAPGTGTPAPVTPVTPAPAVITENAQEVDEEIIAIEPPEVPLAEIPEIEVPVVIPDAPEPEIAVEIELEDPDVPLGNLPQTGLLSVYNILFTIGAGFVASGTLIKMLRVKPRRAKR